VFLKMLDKILGKKEKDNDSNQKNFDEGVKYVEKKEFEPAIESFKRCINVDPEDSKAFVGLCIAYSGLMDLDTAREYYEELKDIDPYLAAQLANTQAGALLEDK
jgi:tetratricopeptide (TPR) repeat protein